MATAGAGDVLTGVIAALLAQKLPAFEAAQLGVFIHGLAGDIARDQNGETGLIAGDIVDSLPDAFVHTTPHDEAVYSLE
jgi:NAD(P)H-hydrate epimerase